MLKNPPKEIQRVEDQEYIDFYEIYTQFIKELEKYDQNLYQYYFGSSFNQNLIISNDFLITLLNKIRQPYPNTPEDKLYSSIYYNLNQLNDKLAYMPNQLLNSDLLNIVQNSKKQNVITYGILQTQSIERCTSCFKELIPNEEKMADTDKINLKFCNHTFCRLCLRNYIVKSTNNLIFLTRDDNVNNNKRVLKCLNRECDFILFLEDYYNVFGEDIFKNIQLNYSNRIALLAKNNKQLKLNCLICGSNKQQDCYFCPENQNIKNPECHFICQECTEIYYKTCRKINNDRTILNQLPCPLPFCSANIISIKESLLSRKIGKNNIIENKISATNKNRIHDWNGEREKRENTIIRYKPKPTSKLKICVCGVIDDELIFTDDSICLNYHYMHTECLVTCISSNISRKMELSYQQIIMCPFSDAGPHLMKSDYIMALLESTGHQNIVRNLMKINMEEQDIFECLNSECGQTFLLENKNSKIVSCIQCCSSYCILCKKFAHGSISCEGNNREEFLNYGFKPCPYCYELFAKDDKCNHVTCSNCKNDFCFRCSAKRSPILAHGNHYHRSFCPDYFTYDGKEDPKEKCYCCSSIKINSGKLLLCPRPKDLENYDIPEEERKFNEILVSRNIEN